MISYNLIKKHKFKFWFLSLIFLVISFLFFFNTNFKSSNIVEATAWQDSAMKPNDWMTMLNKKLVDKNISSRRSLIRNYCNSIFSDELKDWFQNMTFYYSPDKSLFLHSLCSNLEDFDEDNFDDQILEYINDNYFDQIIDPESDCDFWTDMNGCNFAYLLPTLFSRIVDEYTNIKLAGIYWLSNMDDIKKSIENFSNTYFGKPEDVGCDWKIYLYHEPVQDKNTKHCQHPNTYEYFATYLQEIIQLVVNSAILNANEILQWQVPDEECQMTKDTDIIKCSMMSNDYHWENLKNLLLNETMFYNLFITYFVQSSDNISLTQFETTSGVSSKSQELSAEVQALQRETITSQKAIDLTWDNLQNVYWTFPIHIWLMAYREDLINFRDEFAKIYTPVYQMYFRFRNVQDTRR